MQKKRFWAALLAMSLCTGLNIMPGKAINEPAELYKQYYDIVNQGSAQGRSFITAALEDMNGDQIVDLLYLYEESGSTSLDIYSYASDAEQAECVYHLNGMQDTFWNCGAGSVKVGTLGGKAAIQLYTTKTSSDAYTCIIFSSDFSVQEESQYSYIDWWAGENEFGEPISQKLYSESESAFNAFADSFSEHELLAISAGGSLECANGVEEDKFAQILFAQYRPLQLAQLKAEIESNTIPMSDVTDSLLDSEETELLAFMRLFDSSFGYDGGEFTAKSLLPSLHLALMNDTYFSTRYAYQKSGTTVQMSAAELDRLISDIFGAEIPHENVMLGDPEFDEGTLSMTFSGDAVTLADSGYYTGLRLCYEDLLFLYQLSDDIYYGVFQGSEFDNVSPFGYAVLQKKTTEDKDHWRCLYAKLDGNALSADVLQQYAPEETPEPEIEPVLEEPSVVESDSAVLEPEEKGSSVLPVILVCAAAIAGGGIVFIKKKSKR